MGGTRSTSVVLFSDLRKSPEHPGAGRFIHLLFFGSRYNTGNALLVHRLIKHLTLKIIHLLIYVFHQSRRVLRLLLLNLLLYRCI